MAQLSEQLQAALGNGYTVGRELSSGGMSRVFVAEDTRHRRKVVIKVLSPELLHGISAERFEREILTAAALQQANIVPVLTSGTADGVPYFTMPFVEGETLRAHLARGPMSVNEVIGVLRDVSRALTYAHQRGVVHRDIKPDNVLVSGGTAVVTDFGIAKAISASRTASDGATLTQIGTSVGTPAYMAPEQAAGEPAIDARADIYSLGAMAYELLTGRVVFADRPAQRMLAAHVSEAPTPIRNIRSDLPASLANLIMSCLAKGPQDRPQSAAEIARVLEMIANGGGRPATTGLSSAPDTFKPALALYVAAFAVVAIIAKVAIAGIGLPDWVLPGALIVMAVGLPVVLWTGYVHRVARRGPASVPTFTPGGSPSTTVHGTIATIALKAAPHVSWDRTARGGIYAVGAFAGLVAVFMAMRAFGIGPVGSLFATGKLRAKDRIVMTDFTVTSGDTSLAPVVAVAVRAGLSQSSVLTILDPAIAANALERMERPRNEHVDVALAQEIAAREGAKAIVDGVVTTIGTGYVLTLRLLSADSAHVLASFQESGDGTRGLLEAADRVARGLRAKAGESLRSVQNAVPLERGRTASLEALRLYSAADFANAVERDPLKAIRLLRDAVRIDSSFAEAWMNLSTAMQNGGFPRSTSDSASKRAYALRSRLPEGERLLIEADYFGFGPGHDRLKGISAYERALELGVSNRTVLNDLAVSHRSRREFAAADSVYRLAIAADSTSAVAHAGLLRVLINEGRQDAADSVMAISWRRFPKSTTLRAEAFGSLWNRGRVDDLQRWVDSATGVRDAVSPSRPFVFALQLALFRGQLRKAHELVSRAVAADSASGRRASPLVIAARNLQTAAFVGGHVRVAQAELEAALDNIDLPSIPDVDRPDLAIATAFALSAHPERARAIVSEYRAGLQDTALRRYREPAIQTALGFIALAEKRPAEAIKAFRLGDIGSDGPVSECIICLPANLALAFDAAGQPDSAIAAYETYIRTPTGNRVGLDAERLPAAHERLGQLYEAKGDTANAVEHYRAFVELWKNADRELQPRVAGARGRLARLSPERL